MNNYTIKIFFKLFGIFNYYRKYKILSHAIIGNNLLEIIDLEYNRIIIPITNKFIVDKEYNKILEDRNEKILNKKGVLKTV